MDRIPKPGECYRHFKNKLYQVITVARHSETGERMVVYQALYGTFGTFVRPLSMFISEVDHEKYPEAEQKFRFQRVILEELEESENGGDVRSVRMNHSDAKKVDEAGEAMGNHAEKADEVGAAMEHGANGKGNKNLLDFLEARTYDNKLEVLSGNCLLTKEELEAVCEALEITTGTGTRSDMLEAALDYLKIQARYDGKRLR